MSKVYKAQSDKETEVCELRDKVEWYEGDDGSLSLQICSGMWQTSTKKSDDRNCKISSKDEMISCQSIKKDADRGRRSCRVCRTKSSSAKRMWASGLKNMDNLGLSSKPRVQKMEENGRKIDAVSLVEAELDLEIRGLLAGDERRGSIASQSNGRCVAPVFLHRFPHVRNRHGQTTAGISPE